MPGALVGPTLLAESYCCNPGQIGPSRKTVVFATITVSSQFYIGSENGYPHIENGRFKAMISWGSVPGVGPNPAPRRQDGRP
jgi:hypothetical protein